QYNFENGTQGWTGSTGLTVASATAQAQAGTHALVATISGAAGKKDAEVLSPAVGAGKTVTYHVWCPVGSGVTNVQPYVLQGAGGNWAWTGNLQPMSALKAGAWNTLQVTVPAGAAALYSLGVEFTTGKTWTGICYVDAVAW